MSIDTNCNSIICLSKKENQIQKQIQKQCMTMSSLYTSSKSSANTSINNSNEGIKYNSYQRFLDKKKGKIFTGNGNKIETPIQGNKTKSINLMSQFSKCNC